MVLIAALVISIQIRFLRPGLRLIVWMGGVSAIGGIPVTRISEIPFIVVVVSVGLIIFVLSLLLFS